MHILSPETDNCPSWISGRERMTGGWTRDLLVSSRKAHPTEPPRTWKCMFLSFKFSSSSSFVHLNHMKMIRKTTWTRRQKVSLIETPISLIWEANLPHGHHKIITCMNMSKQKREDPDQIAPLWFYSKQLYCGYSLFIGNHQNCFKTLAGIC